MSKASVGKFSPKPLVGTALDYALRENWMIFDNESGHGVDVFYLYPSAASPACMEDVSEVDDYMKRVAMKSYLRCVSALAPYTNIYAPYHRQISLEAQKHLKNADELQAMCEDTVVRTDVLAALDYFFTHCNKDKPYILAGHSQGSCNLKYVFSEYMRLHPELLDRMVACYATGYYFPDSWFEQNPHVKRATDETDTGVLISWNTEGPGSTGFNFPVGEGSFVINPLNWRTDETPAGIGENLGSVECDDELNFREVPALADATINAKRGVLVCTTCEDYMEGPLQFGVKALHCIEWAMFYQNIRENCRKRIEAYFGN